MTKGGMDSRVEHGNDGGRTVRGEQGVPRLRGCPYVCPQLWHCVTLTPALNDLARRGRTPWQIRKTV